MAAGKGSRMTDLSDSKPKCLLPVGNFPMLYYPLSLLKKIGFIEVIVIVQEAAKSEVSNISKKYDLGMNLDVVPLPAEHEDCGTVDSLRRVQDKLTAQTIFILSCDLFTDFHVHQLVDLHRIHSSSMTALFTKNSLDLKSIGIPGPKVKVKRERDFIGLDLQKNCTGGGQICFWSSEADMNEELSLRRTVLQEHPDLKIFSNLTDAHFYIFEKWVLDYVIQDESFSALKGEVLPYLIKKQFSKTNFIEDTEIEDETTLNMKIETERMGIESYAIHDRLDQQKLNLSSWNDHQGDMKGPYRNRSLKCFAYVSEGGTCLRANTMQAYVELNRQITNLLPTLSHNQIGLQIHPNANVQPKAQLGLECFVGENTNIAEKTTIKSSIIGSNCKINEKVRLTNCIVMDNVTVNSLNNISGSILCDDIQTATNCEIKDCIVSKGHVFSEGEKRSNEILCDEEGKMMEI